MTIVLAAQRDLPDDLAALGVGVFLDFTSSNAATEIDRELCERRGFAGKVGETLVIAGTERPVVVLVGLGPPGRCDLESFRRAAAALVGATNGYGDVGIDLGAIEDEQSDWVALAEAVGEGALLSSYRFTAYRSSEVEQQSRTLTVLGPHPKRLASGLARAGISAGAVELARDLVNTPAAESTPTRFCELATDVAAREDLDIAVYDEEQIVAMGLGGLAGVARGSAEPPRLARLTYTPAGVTKLPTVVLVGKGITFDSGGLSLKSATGMEKMKTDMGGAAAVLGAMSACARLQVRVRVVGLMPLTENMPGSRATKPGDVLWIRNGKSIEVLNTDAEGRLVLADGLSLAAEEAPDAIIDLATLTGACVVALGKQIAGLMGNDDRLLAAIGAASRAAGEATWPLPLPAGYRSHIDSEVADMKNIGAAGQAGALSAGLLLEEFVGSVPWAHLDIAGPSRSESDSGYLRKGATGFGVRILLEVLQNYSPLGGTSAGSAGKEVLA